MTSIIIPVYNAEKWLERCVDSILHQTVQDWELILIDDGSTDLSSNLCDLYADKDKRISVIHQKNQGASIARRNGINAAKGEFLTFVDCDDVVDRKYLESLQQALLNAGTRISACNIIRHSEDTSASPIKTEEVECLCEEAIFQHFFKYDFWGFPGKMYARGVFEGVYFPKYTVNEDYVVMAQVFTREHQMAYVQSELYHYMQHENSLSSTRLSPRMFDEYYNKLWVWNYLNDNNPQYAQQAKAQLAESCIKLIGNIQTKEDKQQYSSQLFEMKSFLRKNMFSILMNKFLLPGLKVMALRRAI